MRLMLEIILIIHLIPTLVVTSVTMKNITACTQYHLLMEAGMPKVVMEYGIIEPSRLHYKAELLGTNKLVTFRQMSKDASIYRYQNLTTLEHIFHSRNRVAASTIRIRIIRSWSNASFDFDTKFFELLQARSVYVWERMITPENDNAGSVTWINGQRKRSQFNQHSVYSSLNGDTSIQHDTSLTITEQECVASMGSASSPGTESFHHPSSGSTTPHSTSVETNRSVTPLLLSSTKRAREDFTNTSNIIETNTIQDNDQIESKTTATVQDNYQIESTTSPSVQDNYQIESTTSLSIKDNDQIESTTTANEHRRKQSTADDDDDDVGLAIAWLLVITTIVITGVIFIIAITNFAQVGTLMQH